jgi:hypothetical protein
MLLDVIAVGLGKHAGAWQARSIVNREHLSFDCADVSKISSQAALTSKVIVLNSTLRVEGVRRDA